MWPMGTIWCHQRQSGSLASRNRFEDPVKNFSRNGFRDSAIIPKMERRWLTRQAPRFLTKMTSYLPKPWATTCRILPSYCPGSNVRSSEFGTRSSNSGQYPSTSALRRGTSSPARSGFWRKMARKSAWLGLTESKTLRCSVRQSLWSSY